MGVMARHPWSSRSTAQHVLTGLACSGCTLHACHAQQQQQQQGPCHAPAASRHTPAGHQPGAHSGPLKSMHQPVSSGGRDAAVGEGGVWPTGQTSETRALQAAGHPPPVMRATQHTRRHTHLRPVHCVLVGQVEVVPQETLLTRRTRVLKARVKHLGGSRHREAANLSVHASALCL